MFHLKDSEDPFIGDCICKFFRRFMCIQIYTGWNKKIEPAKYLKKYTLYRKVKKYVSNAFLKAICIQ